MKYCYNPLDERPVFQINLPIGKDEDKPNEPYIDGEEFARELFEVDQLGKASIEVCIISEGGSVVDGMKIYSAILNSKTKVDTKCCGIAYSIAGVIFQAGRKRVMMDFAKLMYHEAYSPDGTESKSLDVINDAITTMVSQRSWKDEVAVKAMMEKTTYISAQEAVDSGLADDIQYSNEVNKPRITSDLKGSLRLARTFFNKLLQPKTMNKDQICKLLGLDANVSDDVAFKALEKHLAKAKKAEEDEDDKKKNEDETLDSMKKALAKAEEDKKAAEDEMNKMKKAAEDEDKKKAAEDKKTKAKEAILTKAKAKGLTFTDKQVDTYVALAKDEESLANVIETIDAITTKKPAAMDMTTVLNKGTENKALLEVDAKGEVTSTEKYVASMNAKARANAKARFSGK